MEIAYLVISAFLFRLTDIIINIANIAKAIMYYDIKKKKINNINSLRTDGKIISFTK